MPALTALPLLCALTLILLGGCATTPSYSPESPLPSAQEQIEDIGAYVETPPAAGTATLVVIDAIGNGTWTTRFRLNDALLGTTDRGIFRVPLAPGRHELSYDIPAYGISGKRALSLGAGATTWIQVQGNAEEFTVTEHDTRRGQRIAVNTKVVYRPSEPLSAYLPGALVTRCLDQDDSGACEELRALPAVLRGPELEGRLSAAEAEVRAREEAARRARAREAQLPVAVRRDKYMIALTSLLAEERFADALPVFAQLESLGTPLDPAFDYFHGEALLRTGDAAGALQRLYSYVAEQGDDADYYREALRLINEAEQAL